MHLSVVRGINREARGCRIVWEKFLVGLLVGFVELTSAIAFMHGSVLNV